MPQIKQTFHSRRSADQERLDLALASAEIGTWDWNLQTGQITWGENFERMHGFEPGAFGTSLEAYQSNIHPDDRERVTSALRLCAEGGPDYAAEYRLVTPDGSIHHVEAHGRMLIGEDHARLIGVCADISDRVKLLENERQARRDAESSELHYRTLAETIPQQVWTARPDGALDFVNQRVTEYFGRSAEEVVGAGWKDVVHPADLSTVVERWAHSLSSGDEYEVEFRLRRHDGRYRWYLGRAIPVRDPDGTIVRWLGTNTDIDEKKRSLGLMATQISVAQLLVHARTLNEVASAILASVCRNLGWTCAQLWVVNRASGLLDLSNSWCGSDLAPCDLEHLGTFNRMERGVGLPGRIWLSKEPAWIEDVQIDPNFPRAGLLRTIGLRSAFGFPLIVGGEVSAILELFSNEYRPVEESTIVTTATFGNQIGQFIERQAAEEARNAALIQLERLQSVTDAALSHLSLGDLLDKLLGKISNFVSSDIGLVLLVDPEKNELYPAAAFGPAAELPRDFRIPVGEGFSGRVAAERKTRTIRQATRQDLVRPEVRALGIDSLMAVPLTLQEKLIGVLMVGSVRDREFQRDEIAFAELVAARLAIAIENSSLYEDAREANRVKDRFISIASHELKTPMTGILGWTAILRNETDPEVIAEAVDWIEQSARTQARLVEDFLDLTRIREGKLVLREEAIDLQSVVRKTLTIMDPVAAQRGVVLESSIPDRPAPVFGDPARLQQVVTNLLSNAIKFTPAGKCVRTALDMEASTAAIVVTDEGAGISAEFLPNIFNAFEQDEVGREAGGLGLGLHIVSTIVKMHGGTIEASSGGPGTGSTFVVRLPMTVARVGH